MELSEDVRSTYVDFQLHLAAAAAATAAAAPAMVSGTELKLCNTSCPVCILNFT